MYEEHPDFPLQLDRNTRIWRYCDFTKFLSLLDRQALFFARADKLEDPFEGTVNRQSVVAHHARLNPNLSDSQKRWVMRLRSQSAKEARKQVVVSCWHMSEDESALWKLYLRGDEGIAIQSTVDRLARSFDRCTHSEQFIAAIRYRQRGTVVPTGNAFVPFVYKLRSYTHEQELRALVMPYNPPVADQMRTGVYIPVEPATLIEAVIVPPGASGWFRELVQSTVNRFGLSVEVRPSRLVGRRVYG